MKFTLKSTSKYGTAYYVREGFKQAVAVPAAQFPGGTAPQELEIGGEGVEFAVKAPKVQQTGLNKALKDASPEVKKKAREAARAATAQALADAGISL